MGILLADNFTYKAKKPIDSRMVCDTVADMVSLAESIIYDGILVYNKETETFYVFKSNNSVDPVLGKWEEFKPGASSSNETHSVEYKQGIAYKKGNLIVFNGNLYISLNDFTSDNIKTTVDESLLQDIGNGNLNSVYIDTDTNCKEYKQGNSYKETDLVRYENNLYLVNASFVSNNTETNADDAFNVDIQAGNLAPVGNEGIAQVLEYSQNTCFKKDSLIYLDKYMARAWKDFISDSSESTIQGAFDADITSGNLSLIGTGESPVTEYLSGTDYSKNTLVFLGDKIARVEHDFNSSSMSNSVTECFEDDIKNNHINLINTDHVDIMNGYAFGNMYFKDTLVYHGNLIARVMNDFISDNTPSNTLDDSFDSDVTSGNLLVLNKEAEPGIKPYKQNTFFVKDKLVFADGRIGRVLQDYISDGAAATIEESINIDIANGNLREMGENYKFKLYKTSQDMDKTIDAINILPVSTIVFENGETVQNMRINEAVYGPLGTLALIKEIDVNLGIIKAKTVNSREMEFMPPAPNSYEYRVVLQGTGYSVGEIIQTSLPDVNAEITSVDLNGGISGVSHTKNTITNANGTGASIEAEVILHVGNGKQWYELPLNKKNAVIKEYKQGESYEKDNLIYLGDILARALQDFTSDSLLPNIEDSFNFDKDSGNLTRMTREDVNVPECLGSVKTDSAVDLPAIAIKGNWILVENCVNFAPGQAGIGLYNGSSWDISPIPQGTFTFPDPNGDGKLYFRKVEIGNTEGQWEAFTSVDGNEIDITIKTKSDLTDNTYVPKKNELIWDSNREILVIGDGTTSLGGLKEFYGKSVTSADILAAVGYTPEDSANKGQANGYAPLDANGKVPAGNLPDSLTDTYSKTEIDNKDSAITTAVTGLVNTEAARAKGVENTLRSDIDTHISDTAKHVTQAEKDAWDAKVNASDLTGYDNHISDTIAHVTQSDKDKWNGMNKAYYVTNISDLPATDNQIGNIGYVQVSAPGITPVVCDQYLWDGTNWNQLDSSQVSLQFNWGSLQGKPASTPLMIDNTVTVAHSHTNKTVLDKIGQSASGNFTYDGVEIGVKVIFLMNENLLPATGENNTLYVIYEDSRVRNYPSISVWMDGSYQILGRGTQDAPPVVGDMSILQSEYFSVVKGSKYNITVSPNQYFAFMPVEILKEIEGLKDQQKEIITVSNQSMFSYNEDLLNISESTKLTISIKEKETILDTVSNFYFSHIDVNLDDYKDIDNIG